MAHLAREGFDPAFGARPLKRIIQREIGDPAAVLLLEGKVGRRRHDPRRRRPRRHAHRHGLTPPGRVWLRSAPMGNLIVTTHEGVATVVVDHPPINLMTVPCSSRPPT